MRIKLPFQGLCFAASVTALWGLAGTCDCNWFLMSFLSPLIEDLVVYDDQWFATPTSAKRKHDY